MWAIKDWDKFYSSAESRKIKGVMPWVRIPNRHDGRGFRRLMRSPEGHTAYACFMLMVQVASRMDVRGVLASSEGPLTADDLEDKTGMSAANFEASFALLSSPSIGWIYSYAACNLSGTASNLPRQDGNPARQDDNLERPDGPDQSIQSVRTFQIDSPKRGEEKRREEKRREAANGENSFTDEPISDKSVIVIKQLPKDVIKFSPDTERFEAEFPQAVSNLDIQNFISQVSDSADQELFFRVLAANNATRKWRGGFSTSAKTYLTTGLWRKMPKPEGTQDAPTMYLPLERE